MHSYHEKKKKTNNPVCQRTQNKEKIHLNHSNHHHLLPGDNYYYQYD